MGKKQIIDIYRITLLFLMLFFICGCSTAKKKTMPLTVPQQKEVSKYKSIVKERMHAKNKLTWDVMAFRDLQQIDLDNDGEKDIVAVYTHSLNCSGVKVIKVNKDKGEVVFRQIFISPNTKIKIKDGVPMIIVRDVNLFGALGLRKIYLWNGKTFVPER